MASSLFGAVFAGPVISLAWMPVRLHLHFSMSRRQDSANAMVQPVPQGRYFHPIWLRVSVYPSAYRGRRMSCLISLISGKRASLLPRADDLVINANLKDTTGPIGVSVTEPSSSANVVNSSCAIQPAPTRLQQCRA